MNLIVHTLIIEDLDTDKIYETGAGSLQDSIAEQMHTLIDDAGGINEALAAKIIGEKKENKWPKIY